MRKYFYTGDRVRFVGNMGPPKGTEGVVVADHESEFYPLDVKFDGDWGQWCINHEELDFVADGVYNA